jgi:two-component system cell cycle sensor histidine kinase/response regulator CckA
MTGDPLRVLHLEASAEVHELVKRKAGTTGLTFRFERAADRAQYEEALRKGQFDLVLADHSIPGFGGTQPLEEALAARPGVAYIAVTGSIGEERACELARLGARDVIHRDRLEHLPAAILAASKAKGDPAAAESHERFRELAENIRDVLWIRDAGTSRFFYVGPAYQTLWGHSADRVLASPEAWPESVSEEDADAAAEVRARAAKAEAYDAEYRIRRPDGSVRWVHDRGFPVPAGAGGAGRLVGIATDVTDRKRLEGELLQSQKMELVGKLAGGIAHDFNNLLTIISGYVSMLLDKENLPAGSSEALKRVFTASRQATGLVRQLLLFSRKQSPKRDVVDLNAEVEAVATMLRRLLGEMILVDFESCPEAPRVSADVAMLEQAIMNLAVNARDAMPRGGRLSIEVSLAPKGSKPRDRSVAAKGDYACVAVRDTGVGIPAPILPRIFEPFFTTKEEGRGTGLGLPTARDIAMRHDGWIDVETSAGVGSVFRIFLPLTKAGVEKAPEADPGHRAGKGTVLLVEDETAVREFAAAVLQQDGYTLLQARSGENALEVWKWHSARIDVVVADVVLPGELSGLKLGERLKSEKPALKVILATGYGRETLGTLEGGAKQHDVLTKPYTPRSLIKAVRDALS